MVAAAIYRSEKGYTPYGGALRLWQYRGHEVILEGPYDTGKTLAALNKLNVFLAKYPGSQGLMVRQTYKSLLASAVVTFERKVLPIPPDSPRCPLVKYGKSRPEWYDYPNGSRLYLGGMDNPDKFLSSEFDIIYINQAEELKLDSFEKLTGRATGRAGNAPYPQVLGDANPDAPTHWIMNRGSLKTIKSRHEDNPTIFNQDGTLTEQGKLRMRVLDNLSGVRYKRGRLGLWVAAEGQVYEEYDPDLHLLSPDFQIPDSWTRYRAIDFGYRNPFVCQWWAEDEDGRLYLYREMYMTQRTVKVHAEQINRLSEGEHYAATVADHDASDRATLQENGIRTIPAKKDKALGLEKTQERFKKQGDGRPRIFFVRDCLVEVDPELRQEYRPVCTVDEIPGYIFPEEKENRPRDEEPIKQDDHGMDAMRYMVMHRDRSSIARVLDLGPE